MDKRWNISQFTPDVIDHIWGEYITGRVDQGFI